MSSVLNEIRQVNRFFFFFSKKLRLSNPWKYKVPFLITIPYLVLLLNEGTLGNIIKPILCSILIIIGIAGIGYLTNDLGDKEKDGIIKKENATQAISVPTIVALFVFFLALSIGPWFYLPMNKYSYWLLTLQFVFFFLYSFKPFRFKERGFLGVITDALYGHLNPAILAAYTFYLIIGNSFQFFNPFLLSLALWQFFLGIRNIVFHQIQDYEKDIQSSTNTFVTNIGEQRAINLAQLYLIPIEIFLFLGFAFLISYFNPYLIVFIVLYWVAKFILSIKRIRTMNYRQKAYLFLDDLYIKWIPLLVLLLLCLKSKLYIPLLILHFVLFQSEIKSYILKTLRKIFRK